MSTPQHEISIAANGKEIKTWLEYEFSASMLQPAESFTMKRAFDKEAYKLCRPDTKITVMIDGTPILTGLIGSRKKNSSRTTNTFTITGHDISGRMVQESAPQFSFDNQELFDIAAKLADPWFPSVVTSNARNRRVMRGKLGKQVAGGNDPLIVRKRRRTWRVEPGQTRWQTLENLTSEAGYLLFPSSDARELIIGKPNYTQAVQWAFLNTEAQCNVIEIEIEDSVADRYSMIIAVGAGGGDAANYGASTSTRRGVVKNGPNPDGTGKDFQYPKRLIMGERTMQDLDEATLVAQREMNRRDFSANQIMVRMESHGQVISGVTPTIFTYDTLGRVVDDEADIDGDYCVYACRYYSDRPGGEKTELKMVPKGTEFVQ